MYFFFKNFLTNRRIKVKLNGYTSTEHVIENGVPQGSPSSSKLFIITVNEIFESIQDPVFATMYADDISIGVAGKRIDTSTELLQNTLIKLQDFAFKNGFIFSSSKSVEILFEKRDSSAEPQLYFKEEKLQVVREIRVLGLIFDKKLTWSAHINNLKYECYKKLNILKILSGNNWGADLSVLRNTYISIVRSKIDYASIIYGTAKIKVLKKLDTLNNSAARIITGAFKSSPIPSLLAEANIVPLENRRNQLLINYISNLSANPGNQNYIELIKAQNKFSSAALKSRLNFILNNLQTSLPKTMHIETSNYPPWRTTPIEVDFSLLKIATEYKSRPESIKNIFENKLDSDYTEFIPIYTDASSTNNEIGCAIFSPFFIEKKFKPPEQFSVASSEHTSPQQI